jgi:hypothetical protein
MTFEHPKNIVQSALQDVDEVAGGMSRKKDRTVAISFGLWLGLYFVARLGLESTGLIPWQRVAIALMPVPFFMWFLWGVAQWIARSDELERLIQLEALAIAFPLTVVLIMTLGLLQIAIELSMDDWSYRHLWPIIYIFYLFGVIRARRRYL